ARRARLHVEPAACGDRGRRRADRMGSRRRAADAGPRLAAQARRSVPLLLEERQVAARPGAPPQRPPRLLGALRLPQRRRLLERAALRLLVPLEVLRTSSGGRPQARFAHVQDEKITRSRDRPACRSADNSARSTSPQFPPEEPPPRAALRFPGKRRAGVNR